MRKTLLSSAALGLLSASLLVAACGGDDDDGSMGASGASGSGNTLPGAGGSDSTSPGAGGSDGTLPGAGGSDGTLPGAGGSDGAGGASPSTGLNFACYVKDQGLCSAQKIFENLRSMYESTCMNGAGTAMDACPTGDDLAGCCTYPGPAQTCVYGTSAPALTPDKCSQTGGTWAEQP